MSVVAARTRASAAVCDGQSPAAGPARVAFRSQFRVFATLRRSRKPGGCQIIPPAALAAGPLVCHRGSPAGARSRPQTAFLELRQCCLQRQKGVGRSAIRRLRSCMVSTTCSSVQSIWPIRASTSALGMMLTTRPLAASGVGHHPHQAAVAAAINQPSAVAAIQSPTARARDRQSRALLCPVASRSTHRSRRLVSADKTGATAPHTRCRCTAAGSAARRHCPCPGAFGQVAPLGPMRSMAVSMPRFSSSTIIRISTEPAQRHLHPGATRTERSGQTAQEWPPGGTRATPAPARKPSSE